MTLPEIAKQTLALIDLTTLNDNDSDKTVLELCQNSQTEFGSVAAVCILRQFIPLAKRYFSAKQLEIKIASVSNFPAGDEDLALALRETQEALDLGADEVDIVFPYRALLAGNQQIGAEMIRQAKQICGLKTLKVIIESGVLQTPRLIELASNIAIENGADFIKTSTGKATLNATLEATEIMLQSIKRSGKNCGFKAAGGIRLVSEAQEYLALAERIMGKNWLNSANFRFGASSLLADVLNILRENEACKNG